MASADVASTATREESARLNPVPVTVMSPKARITLRPRSPDAPKSLLAFSPPRFD